MDLKLPKQVRVLASSSTDIKSLERRLPKSLTFSEQRIVKRLASRGEEWTARMTIGGSTGQTIDDRGGVASPFVLADADAIDDALGFCAVCAEFNVQKALRLIQSQVAGKEGSRSTIFVGKDGSCQIMAKLPAIMRAYEVERCRPCCALIMGIDRLYDTTDSGINYDDNDIEATIIFKKDNVLRLSLSRRSTGDPVQNLKLSFFALPTIEFFTLPGEPRLFSTIGSDMTKLYPEHPDSNIDGGQAGLVGLADYPSKGTSLVLNQWLKECLEEHTTCSRVCESRGQKLPKRVIDVSGTHLRLVQSRGRWDSYVALSHCWGAKSDSNLLRCTTANMTEFRREIPLDRMPKTFRDAVEITRMVGFRFLWIDALCIIQDSTSDWAEQCEQMVSIYSSAALVVSATASYDSSGGCFHETLPTVAWDDNTSAGVPASLCIRQCHDHSMFSAERARVGIRTGEGYKGQGLGLAPPTFQRAWCYQERLLGVRTVHFADTEMVFECLTTVSCECGALRHHRLEHIVPPEEAALITPDGIGNSNPSIPLGRRWQNVVESFSAQELSYEADKLPALAGLAKHFQRLGMKSYYAGHFGNGSSDHSLIESLIWRNISGNDRSRPTTFVAPSWSWASVTAKIWFEWRLDSSEGFQDGDYFANILDIKCVPENKANPFGRVESGLLRLEGWMSSGELWLDPDPENVSLNDAMCFLHYGHQGVYRGRQSSPLQTYSPDCFDESRRLAMSRETVWCLWLCTDGVGTIPGGKIGSLYGLIIVRSKGAWKRVGRCWTKYIEYLPEETAPRPRALEWQEVTII